MAQKEVARFPDPHEVEVPEGLEGWEEMYPPHFLFSEEREKWEDGQFWYRLIHASAPLPPLDQIFQQAWQISLSQHTTRVYCIPPAQGVVHRVLGCYQYISAAPPPPEEMIKEKAEKFGVRVPYVFENFDKLFDEWLPRMQELGRQLATIKVPEVLPKYMPDEEVPPNPYRGYTPAYELIEAFHRAVDCMYKGWQYHFNYLNLTKLGSLMFSDVARKLFPGIGDSAIGKMMAGDEAYMFRPEEELCRLSRLAYASPPVADVLRKDVPAAQKMDELRKFDAGREWLAELDRVKDPWFSISCGSGWLHYEGSWINKMDVPFGYLRGYIERLDRGERIEREPLEEMRAARDKLVDDYRKLIQTDEDRKSFDDAYKNCRAIYKNNENHLFWVEHWFHTIWYDKMREIGRVLVQCGALKGVDDIFMFNRLEIPSLIEDAVTSWALGEGIPMLKWDERAEKRRRILTAAQEWTPPVALGIPPEEVAEPFTVVLWGVTTERVKDWLKGVAVVPEEITELKGFNSSAGGAEGPARVVKVLEDIVTVQPGEILVCPSTNPAWAPVLSKVKATVTDIGGLMSHAAIVSREYGVPSVTGTGNATLVIKTGDIIKVDGDNGVVTIVKRAG